MNWRDRCRIHLRQRGVALLIMLIVMIVGALFFFIGRSQPGQLQNDRDRLAAEALAQAKESIIGDAVSESTVASAGYLRLPDLGFAIGSTPSEGSSAPNFSGNHKDYSVIGRLPWKSLGIPPLRGRQGECLWYAVSGHFKNNPKTDAFNWDTPGQIDVVDGNGAVIASNLAALIVAPGAALDSQDRTLADPAYLQCGGNYDVRNYLDPYDIANAVSGQVNYFTGSTNNRVASSVNNKQFVLTNSNHYNDRFLYVTADDIFRPIIRRADFKTQVGNLLDDPIFQSFLRSVSVTGSKGTASVACIYPGTSGNQKTTSSADNNSFCNNWLEMLLLTQLQAPTWITIDALQTPTCSRVLIFAGKKTGAQVRGTVLEKANVANYLEGANAAAFGSPTAISANFVGSSTFAWNNPGVDIVRCLP
jgi:hypothetical protein